MFVKKNILRKIKLRSVDNIVAKRLAIKRKYTIISKKHVNRSLVKIKMKIMLFRRNNN